MPRGPRGRRRHSCRERRRFSREEKRWRGKEGKWTASGGRGRGPWPRGDGLGPVVEGLSRPDSLGRIRRPAAARDRCHDLAHGLSGAGTGGRRRSRYVPRPPSRSFPPRPAPPPPRASNLVGSADVGAGSAGEERAVRGRVSPNMVSEWPSVRPGLRPRHSRTPLYATLLCSAPGPSPLEGRARMSHC